MMEYVRCSGASAWRCLGKAFRQHRRACLLTCHASLKRIALFGKDQSQKIGVTHWDAARVRTMLRFIKQTWPGDKHNCAVAFVEAVDVFLRGHAAVLDERRAIEKLSMVPVTELIANAASIRSALRCGSTEALAEAMRVVYNKRLTSHKLESLLRHR